MSDPDCAFCETKFASGLGRRLFRCRECGDFLQCEVCCLHHHRFSPLHFLEEWKQDHWEKTTLTKLGLIFQVGHEGRSCPSPALLVRRMVVVDTSGIHLIKYRFCKCERAAHANNLQQLLRTAWFPATITDPTTCATFRVLDLFRVLNVVGNVNAHDFVTSLERLSDATGVLPLPDRYKQFIRMAREYTFLQRVRRAARGNFPGGLAATKLGECMVMCWPCPHDGRNMPENWRDVDPKYRFLYMLLLAIDANFKMKNRIRKNERYDPSLGPGWGAFVEPSGYKKHLSTYVGEEDISTCIAFAALLQKDTRNTAGLRVSGVGGCVCARHECMRANGLGDLQKGERYANMDYIVMSALRGLSLTHLTLSYDIACQWKKNLATRMAKLPEGLQLLLDNFELQCGLPVWHASSHQEECRKDNSLSFLVGVGKTDGEGIERFWAAVNQVGYSTKESGLGTRADAVEDKIDAHNFLKNVGQGDALLRKLIIAVAERARQVESFKEVDSSVARDVRKAWLAQIDAYLADRTQPNPYASTKDDSQTEAQIRLVLKKEEEKDARSHGTPLQSTSATAFLVAGMQLEHTQRRIKAEVSGLALVTADRESKLHELRLSFFKKLRKFRDLQAIYMPGAIRAVQRDEASRDSDAEPIKAEFVKLWMPSELTAAQREVGIQRGLGEMEAKLREAQCSDALTLIRQRLHTKRHLIGCRDRYITGQNASTKARKLIDLVGDKANASAAKYRRAREALSVLKGEDYAPQFKVLKQEHMTLDGELMDEEVAQRQKLALAGVGKKGRLPRHQIGSTKKTLSWIWTVADVTLTEADEPALHEAVRVEWSTARARKVRWEEEVAMIREEMRRVLRYLEWQCSEWDARVAESMLADPSGTDPLEAGRRSYAVSQGILHRKIQTKFRVQWNQSLRTAATSVLASEAGAELNEFYGQGKHTWNLCTMSQQSPIE
ncbi:hypothetical protein B0H15DRAFT_793973 [Mycena belliarum]|uniref:CxC2-like cysteine cluster KDZ transposase-associated domain-containing protein n=1 Tax=Mycena belliarum TaxID=1033014 RepID=A0AAD6TQV6_9AGAR|nr:hypothetical protein B0H15DRAFT_793973 [Mycena belliae]